jgi:hypothetical protein
MYCLVAAKVMVIGTTTPLHKTSSTSSAVRASPLALVIWAASGVDGFPTAAARACSTAPNLAGVLLEASVDCAVIKPLSWLPRRPSEDCDAPDTFPS